MDFADNWDEMKLYKFNNDDKLDYLSKTFSGDACGSTPMHFIYELYSMEAMDILSNRRIVAGRLIKLNKRPFLKTQPRQKYLNKDDSLK